MFFFDIPHPNACQMHNSLRGGAAFEGRQDSLTPRAIANWILHKIEHPESLGEIAEKMRGMATPDAAARVADIVLSLTPPA